MKWKFWLLGSSILLLDQVSKALIRQQPLGEKVAILPGLWFTYVQNTGSSFGMLQGRNIPLIFVSLLALVGLWYYRSEFPSQTHKALYASIIAGITGNLLDRIFFGAVTDLFDLGWWPVFNVADSALVVGVIGLIILEFKNQKSSRSSSLSK